MLQTPPDIYFSQQYGTVVAAAEGGEWHSLQLQGGRWQLPIIIRTLPSGRRDAVSPYGYSGVYLHPSLERNADELWAETRAILDEDNIVSLFIRASPLVAQAPPPPDSQRITDSHPTYLVPVDEPETMWSLMEGRARTSIRKAQNAGLTATVDIATEDDIAPCSPFRELYASTMSRVSASSYYFFGDTYFSDLRAHLGLNLLIGTVRDNASRVVGASLFMVGPSVIHYHLSGSTLDGARLGGTNLLIWESLRYAFNVGATGLHLGGGLADGDGLDRFKRSFGGQALIYSAYGLVINQQSYDAEVNAHAQRLGVLRQELMTPGFFPIYRRMANE